MKMVQKTGGGRTKQQLVGHRTQRIWQIQNTNMSTGIDRPNFARDMYLLTSVWSIISPVFWSMTSPNVRPFMLHLLKVITFCVRVPVLSEKMYWIWPSSSFNVVVRALADVCDFSWYIFSSQFIKNDWAKRMTCAAKWNKCVTIMGKNGCHDSGLTSTET